MIVQLDKASLPSRVAEAGRGIVSLVDRWSKGERDVLCSSPDFKLSGYLFRSTKPLHMMRAEFEKSGETLNADSMILFEVGEAFTTIGFTRVATWLQRH